MASKDIQNLKEFVEQTKNIVKLGDCLDGKDLKNAIYDKRALEAKKKSSSKFGIFIISTAAVMLYLRYRKVPVLQFSSYINNMYSVPLIFGLTYSFLLYASARRLNSITRRSQTELDIVSAHASMLTEAVEVANFLKQQEKKL